MDLSKVVAWICQPLYMDFSELLCMDLSKLIQDEKFIFLQANCCILFAQTRQCEQWLIRKGRQLHTCPKKEKKMAFVHRI